MRYKGIQNIDLIHTKLLTLLCVQLKLAQFVRNNEQILNCAGKKDVGFETQVFCLNKIHTDTGT